jgi:Bacterial Ig-like domain (group 3)
LLYQRVVQAGTATALVASANPSGSGQSVTLTATVGAASPGSGTPTGTVTFYDGSLKLGRAALSGGAAAFTTSALSIGNHAIRAVYGGDVDFKATTSAVLSQVVQGAPAATVMAATTSSISSPSATMGSALPATSRSLAASAVDLAIAALQDETTSGAPPDEPARLRVDTRSRWPLSPPMGAARVP